MQILLHVMVTLTLLPDWEIVLHKKKPVVLSLFKLTNVQIYFRNNVFIYWGINEHFCTVVITELWKEDTQAKSA